MTPTEQLLITYRNRGLTHKQAEMLVDDARRIESVGSSSGCPHRMTRAQDWHGLGWCVVCGNRVRENGFPISTEE